MPAEVLPLSPQRQQLKRQQRRQREQQLQLHTAILLRARLPALQGHAAGAFHPRAATCAATCCRWQLMPPPRPLPHVHLSLTRPNRPTTLPAGATSPAPSSPCQTWTRATSGGRVPREVLVPLGFRAGEAHPCQEFRGVGVARTPSCHPPGPLSERSFGVLAGASPTTHSTDPATRSAAAVGGAEAVEGGPYCTGTCSGPSGGAGA